MRHAESNLNADRRISGRLDVGLSPRGREDAESLVEILRDLDIDRVVTSTLRRTYETVAPFLAAHPLACEDSAALDEIDHGMLEGRYRDVRDPAAHALWQARKRDKLGFRAPGGESLLDVRARVLAWAAAAFPRMCGERVLIVAHRNTLRVLLGALLGMTDHAWVRLDVRHQFIYVVPPATPQSIATVCLRGTRRGACIAGMVQ
ncbi:MAG: histidine phosphatase family protein [Gammaproteobacteria bacterium]